MVNKSVKMIDSEKLFSFQISTRVGNTVSLEYSTIMDVS